MILDFGDGFFLRRATADDHDALCAICLRTGNAGADATSREDDPSLLGMIYAVPYQVHEPNFAFVVDSADGVAGYLLGTPDTAAFNLRLAQRWYPALRARTPTPPRNPHEWRGSDWARQLVHQLPLEIPPELEPYPASGHIDLLPHIRSRHIGRRCMAFLQDRLRDAGATGMFLDIHPRNERARGFYRSLGFGVVPENGAGGRLYMAKRF